MKDNGIIQFVKFGLVGVLNTGVDWVVFYLLTASLLANSETIAKAIAFVVAMINSYILNTIWTFRKEYKETVGSGGTGKASAVFAKFAVVSIVGWGLNTFVFDYARFHLDQSKLLALIFASGAAILWNFFINKFWTYRK